MNGELNSDKKKYFQDKNSQATGISIGIAIGVALGVALHNLAIGIGCGVAIGVGIGSVLKRKKKDNSNDKK